jgi:hypothetical protein
MKKRTQRIRIQMFNQKTGWKSDSDEVYPHQYKNWVSKQYPKFPQATHVRIGNDCIRSVEEILNKKPQRGQG